MKTFKDRLGREYTIRLTLGTAKDVYDNLGIDLLNPTSNTTMAKSDSIVPSAIPVSVRVLTDDMFLFTIVEEMIKGQFEKSNVTRESFLDAMDGAAVKQMAEAFIDEFLLFFAERGNKFLLEAIQKQKDAIKNAEKKALEELNGNEYFKQLENVDVQTGEN